MIIGAGTAFMLVLFYLITLLASRVSVRRFYKWMWSVAATLLGVSICIGATVYLAGLLAVLVAL